jgi:5-methylcytosine-specific restriction endonuclease McrA
MDERWAGLSPEQKLARSRAVQKCRKNRQRNLKEMFGGKCSLCGYCRCFRALEFHHINPAEKLFGLATRGHTRSFEVQVAEARKCILLCANCHREVEDGMWAKGKLSPC